MARVTVRRGVARVDGGETTRRMDSLIVEEPLEIRIDNQSLAVTMRTPGDDFDLVAGFLLTEGAITSAEQIAAMRYCAGSVDGENTYNVIDVSLAPGTSLPDTLVNRNFYVTSSCGVCGKASIDAITTRAAWEVRGDSLRLDASTISALPSRLRKAQQLFDRTGGVHAAGLFDAEATLVALREDVGRHNAADKVVGWALRENRVPLREHVLVISGRASFELVQKAWMAGVPVVAAVSAASSLAAELADEAGMTLVGFLRGSAMNVYAGHHRIAPSPSAS